MSQKEQRELDAWIAEHVMGWIYDKPTPYRKGAESFAFWNEGSTSRLVEGWTPTNNRADTMQVLEKCLLKMHEEYDDDRTISSQFDGVRYCLQETDVHDGICVEAMTLALTICKFAKELFSK